VKLIDKKSEMAEEVGDVLPPLWTLLKQVENMPMEPTILESHLSQIRSRDHVLDALKNVFGATMGTQEGSQNIEALIQSFIRQYSNEESGQHGESDGKHGTNESNDINNIKDGNGGKEDNKDQSDSPFTESNSTLNTKKNVTISETATTNNAVDDEIDGGGQYLLRFLRYIMNISNSLRSAAREQAAATKVTTVLSLDVTTILSRSPRALLAQLVFDLGGLEEAQRLTSLLRLDLMKVILRYSRSKSSPSTSNTSSSNNAIMGGVNSSNFSNTASLPLKESAKASKGPNGGRKILDMNIIEFLSRLEKEQLPISGLNSTHGQILAPLACLLRVTTPRVDGSFINYALEHSVPFRCLHRWMCQRAQAWSNFIAIFVQSDEEAQYSLSFRARDFQTHCKCTQRST